MSTLFNTPQAAQYLKDQGAPFTKGTLEVWRCKKEGPQYQKIRHKVFYRKEWLDAFIQGTPVKTLDSMVA